MQEEAAVLEREVKLVVGDAFILPELDGPDFDGASLGPVEERQIRDTYYDTACFRLARWGCTLRFRDGEGWTAKIPVPTVGRALSREEVTFDGPPDRPPPRAVALLRSLTRGRPVEEVARFSTSRSAWTWRGSEGTMIVELADDRVQVEIAGGGSSAWREIEVELAPGVDESHLVELVKRLESAGAVAGGNVPKLVRGVGGPAAGPPDVVEPDLAAQPTAREVIQAGFARSVTHLLLHVPPARIGRDIEGVHQARVATRRLRSDLRTFGPLLDPEWATGLELDLKWLADDLGKIRDADVLLARFRATIGDHPELDPVGARNIVKALEQQRRRDNTTLLGHLARKRADQLFDRLVDAATDPMTAPQADDPAVEKLPKLVRKRWRRLERTVEALDAEPPVDDLHRVRILAKRTRYAAEAVVPVFGPEAKALAKPVAKIQDVLGELNDAEVAETWLAAMAETADGPTAFAAGRLAQIAGSEADSSRHDWQKHYRRAADKKRQAWLR